MNINKLLGEFLTLVFSGVVPGLSVFTLFIIISSLCKICVYSECSKITNIFLFLFSNEIIVIKAAFHKMFVRIANMEDTDQTATYKHESFLFNYS